MLYRMRARTMLLITSLTLAGCSITYGLALHLGDCADGASVGHTLLGALLLFGGADPPFESGLLDHAGCMALTAVAQYTQLAVHVSMFAIVTTRLLTPRVTIAFSPMLLASRRNGEPQLMLRVCHPQGHNLFHVHIAMTWLYPNKTSEGENYMASIPLSVHHKTAMLGPQTVRHDLADKASPLRNHRDAIAEATGSILVVVAAYDPVLRAQVHSSYLYKLAEDVQVEMRFPDAVLVGAISLINEPGACQRGQRPTFDISKILSPAVRIGPHGKGQKLTRKAEVDEASRDQCPMQRA